MLSWTFFMAPSKTHFVVRIKADRPIKALHRAIQSLRLYDLDIGIIRGSVELVFRQVGK
ncbi:hypothetical protein ABIA45_007412 [Bradyrhizobium sp. USDA 336]